MSKTLAGIDAALAARFDNRIGFVGIRWVSFDLVLERGI